MEKFKVGDEVIQKDNYFVGVITGEYKPNIYHVEITSEDSKRWKKGTVVIIDEKQLEYTKSQKEFEFSDLEYGMTVEFEDGEIGQITTEYEDRITIRGRHYSCFYKKNTMKEENKLQDEKICKVFDFHGNLIWECEKEFQLTKEELKQIDAIKILYPHMKYIIKDNSSSKYVTIYNKKPYKANKREDGCLDYEYIFLRADFPSLSGKEEQLYYIGE